jgi:nascent polypeptide-associated complex subunit alpha
MPGAIVEEEKSQIESIKEQLKLEKEDDVVVEDVKEKKKKDARSNCGGREISD